jgi:hypothetical protein
MKPPFLPPLIVAFVLGAAVLPRVEAAVLRTESGSPPLRWNFDQYLAEYFPDQNPDTRAIRFHLGTTVSRFGSQSNEWNAVRAAFAQWQAIPNTKIRFEEAAPVTAPSNLSALDGRNDIVWLSPGTYGRGDLGERISLTSGTIALTMLALDFDFDGNSTGTIVEADTVINRDLNFTTDYGSPTSSQIFLESTVLHEIGHWLGMNHSPLGAATLWWYSGNGVGAGAGLSSDDVSFARSTYGQPGATQADGVVTGTVTIGGNGVSGALVSVEQTNGIVVAGTITEPNGTFRIPGIPAGSYRLRTYPCDPNSGGDSSLVRGLELDVSAARRFAGANTAFLPFLDSPISLNPGGTVQRTLVVTPGNPPFRITEVRIGFNASGRASGDQPLLLPAGASNLWVGVFVPNILPSNAVLRVTGPGITHGPSEVLRPALRQLTLVQTRLDVAADAVPGMRSIEVTADGFTASAVGFVDLNPLAPDHNFDGLNDLFQRRYFAPWTAANAAPEADPDGDGFVNRREATMGSDPTDRLSVAYRLTRIRMTGSGTEITWESAPGRRYQLWRRETLATPWLPVGAPFVATGETSTLTDGTQASPERFYRITEIP